MYRIDMHLCPDSPRYMTSHALGVEGDCLCIKGRGGLSFLGDRSLCTALIPNPHSTFSSIILWLFLVVDTLFYHVISFVRLVTSCLCGDVPRGGILEGKFILVCLPRFLPCFCLIVRDGFNFDASTYDNTTK